MKLVRLLVGVLAVIAWALPVNAAPVLAASPAMSPTINLSPDSGPAGTSVTVTGTGFPKRSSGTVSAGPDTAAFTAGASGSFTAELVIPETTDPVVSVQASAARAAVSAPFTLTYSTPLATGQEPAAAPATATAPAPAPAVTSTAPLRFGVGTPGGPLAAAELDEVAALAGEAPSIILSYKDFNQAPPCLLYTSPSPRDGLLSRMPSSA